MSEKIPFPITLQIDPSQRAEMEKTFSDPAINVDIVAVDPNGDRRIITRANACGPEVTDLVSAITVTRASRLDMLARALHCFGKQTYKYRELIIVSDDLLELPADIAKELNANVKLVLAEKGTPLGSLRNLGISHASGQYVVQWDDDDWYHPERISRQLRTLLDSPEADACTLERWTLAWPARNLYAISRKRPWEGTLLARRWRLPCYPALKKLEDTPLVSGLRLVSLDAPELYIYVFHGENTWSQDHFEKNFKTASEIIELPLQIATIKENLGLSSSPSGAPTSILPPKKRPKIALIYSPGFTSIPFDFSNLLNDHRGLTGSEKALFMYGRELARLGYNVTIFAHFTRSGFWQVGSSISIHCRQYDVASKILLSEQPDVAIAVNQPLDLRFFPKALRIFNQQVNDFSYCPDWEKYVDVATSPSTVHMNFLKTQTKFANWQVLPNGCDIATPHSKTPWKIIHASSPDRGLHHLLALFPRLRKMSDRDLTLDVYYELDRLIADVKKHNIDGPVSLRVRNIEILKEHLTQNRAPVQFRGQASCDTVSKAFAEASFMLYPCDPVSFTEGFSVSTLEAAQAGALPIITGADALTDIYGDFLPVVPAPYQDHHALYLETCLKLMRDGGAYTQAVEKARAGSSRFYWSNLVRRLVDIIQS